MNFINKPSKDITIADIISYLLSNNTFKEQKINLATAKYMIDCGENKIKDFVLFDNAGGMAFSIFETRKMVKSIIDSKKMIDRYVYFYRLGTVETILKIPTEYSGYGEINWVDKDQYDKMLSRKKGEL